ncbi:hypothetical protein ACAG26_16445 [Mycobacterium sp. pUA109]|uniref:hypothetical protein n=1 Tax=Mycobacterium sp. pUA109 TaxID=3238982 RepID=UPI00351BA2C2
MSAKPVVAAAAALSALVAPPVAAAQPPGFPDLNAFSPVDPQGYLRIDNAGQPGDAAASTTRVYFSTSDGVLCRWVYVPPGIQNPIAYPATVCSGDIPGIPDSVPDDGGPGCAQVGQAAPFSAEYAFNRHWGACPPFNAVALDPGQKIATGSATCVAGAGSLIACIDPVHDHGFVLQPSGSWVF